MQMLDAGSDHGDQTMTPRFDPVAAAAHLDGYIVVINAVAAPHIAHWIETGKPVVLLSNDTPQLACPRVLPSNTDGIREAVSHLVEHGNRRIAFVGNLLQHDIVERHAAYVAALREHGIEPDERLVVPADNNMEDGGLGAGARLLAAGLPSTAVVAATDLNAMGVMRALTDAGLAVPKSQAVVGFDDIAAAAHLTPALSTVRQDMAELGAAATELLLSTLNGGAAPSGRHFVPSRFVARESCGCAPSHATTAHARAVPISITSAGEALATEIRAVLAEDRAGDQSVLAAADDAVADLRDQLHSAVAHGEPAAARAEHVWLPLLRLARTPDAVVRMIAAVQRLGTRALGGDVDREVGSRLQAFVHESVLGFARVQLRREFDGVLRFEAALRGQFEISMDLLQSESEDPRSLGWLRHSGVRLGCLGLWVPGDGHVPPERLLHVAGLFEREGRALHLLRGRAVAPEAFPPAEFMAALDETREEVAVVLPIRVDANDWGMLALVVAVEAEVSTGREALNQLAALLGVALQHESVLQSLREQRRRLADAVRRERELLDTVRVSEERYALAAQARHDGVWDSNVQRNETYYSPRWKAILGYRDDGWARRRRSGSTGCTPTTWRC